jgi:hypothetical protein
VRGSREPGRSLNEIANNVLLERLAARLARVSPSRFVDGTVALAGSVRGVRPGSARRFGGEIFRTSGDDRVQSLSMLNHEGRLIAVADMKCGGAWSPQYMAMMIPKNRLISGTNLLDRHHSCTTSRQGSVGP